VFESLQHFEKILVVLKRVLNYLVSSRAVLEKKILRNKVVICSESTENHIQKLISINDQFSLIYENCQACHRSLFKTLPIEVDCIVLKIYISITNSLVATAAKNEQNSILFHKAKELGLTSRACKAGEWPCVKLIDFREGAEPCQEVKEKVLAKKWTNISIEDSNEKLKCDCDACSFQKPYAFQQPLMKRHQ
jgi:hypothetical protein